MKEKKNTQYILTIKQKVEKNKTSQNYIYICRRADSKVMRRLIHCLCEITLTCYTNSCRFLKGLCDIFRKITAGDQYIWRHVSVYGIQRTAATFKKKKFGTGGTTWSMPLPLTSPHSSVTKWRSDSHESKSIVNYVMLFLWAIIYDPYLSQRRCRQLAPQKCSELHRRRVPFCQRLKKNKTSEIGAALMFQL